MATIPSTSAYININNRSASSILPLSYTAYNSKPTAPIVIYPLFIGITALARLIVLQGKDSAPEQLVFEAGSILLLSLAALLLKDVKVSLTQPKK